MPDPTPPEAILTAMAVAYHRADTYRDTGVLTRHVIMETGLHATTEKHFATAFVRPDRFRFEYTERTRLAESEAEPPRWRTVVWGGGDSVQASKNRGDGDEVTTPASLRDELSALGGVSSQLSWIVPFLILPGECDGRPWKLLKLTRLNDATLDGTECYRVQGYFPTHPGHDEVCQQAVREAFGEDVRWEMSSGPKTFWIEKGRLLLRRWTDTHRTPEFRAEAVATYSPEIDVPIPDCDLEFGVEQAE